MRNNRVRFVMRGMALGALIAALFSLVGLTRQTTLQASPQNAGAAAAKSPVPDLSGYWETEGTLRINGQQEQPVYTAQAQARQDEQRNRANAGQVVSETSRYCRTLAYPFFMGSSPPFNIIQGPHEIMVLAEREMGSRHIFMDRPHPPPALLERMDNGDAVGHWEGDTLVVDTIGFQVGQMGGAQHGPDTHLVERYKLLDGGKKLSVTFTWEDPDTYAKPYTYERIFYRSPKNQYAMEDWCDASDSLQWRSDATPNLAPHPKQNP